MTAVRTRKVIDGVGVDTVLQAAEKHATAHGYRVVIAIVVRPSREIEQQVTDGRLGALALHGARALTGGVPLTVDGQVVGAIGTSGETPDEDESVSAAGAAAPVSTREVPALSYAAAQVAVRAIGEAATSRGAAPVAAAVDAGGTWCTCGARTRRRWPASAWPPTRPAPRRSTGGPAGTSSGRPPADDRRPSTWPARCPCRAACPSRWTATSSAPSV